MNRLLTQTESLGRDQDRRPERGARMDLQAFRQEHADRNSEAWATEAEREQFTAMLGGTGRL